MVTFAEGPEELVNVGGLMLPKRYGQDASAQAVRRKFNKTARKNDAAVTVGRVWDVLDLLVRMGGIPPTVREIAATANLAVGTVHGALLVLERNGVIKRQRGARGVRLLLHPRRD